MNRKFLIPISIIITIVIVVLSLTQNEIIENQVSPETDDGSEISNILNKIKEDRIKNEESDKPYYPSEREWNQSGPFFLDRSQYIMGEKMFVQVHNLGMNEKGQMIFSKIINSTHSYNYKKIPFDGSKPQQNFYVGFDLNSQRGNCSIEKFVGNWELIFAGTDYESIKFKVLDQILPGSERLYQPVC
jgi:hypothetical protein